MEVSYNFSRDAWGLCLGRAPPGPGPRLEVARSDSGGCGTSWLGGCPDSAHTVLALRGRCSAYLLLVRVCSDNPCAACACGAVWLERALGSGPFPLLQLRLQAVRWQGQGLGRLLHCLMEPQGMNDSYAPGGSGLFTADPEAHRMTERRRIMMLVFHE
jgi:hypothetical protein